MAMGAMAALHRRTTEGGSWLVRTSLAAAGKWVRDFGLVPAELLADVSRELPQAVVAPFLMDSASPAGRLTHLAPAARLSETPGRWERPAVPPGCHPAPWPARPDG